MRESLPSELLIRLMNATPEQMAAIERILGVGAERGARSAVFEEVSTAPRNVFRRAGSHWDVRFEGGECFHLEATLGAKYLDYLLHHPGEVISAFDLEVAICPDKANARSRDSIQEKLDPDTVRSYLRELTRLRQEREDAAERGDRAEVDRLDEEVGAVEAALRVSGRDAGDAGERARGNVSKAIAVVRRRLAAGSKAEREFGRHIEQFVSVGYECSYRQPNDRFWEA